MRLAIVSDVHGNRHALEATLEDIGGHDTDQTWCLGDVVGYGADPNECVALAREHTDICLAGNHDLAVTGEIALDDFARGAAIAAEWTRDVIGHEEMRWLSRLRPLGEAEGVGLFHGSPRDPVWEYVITALAAEMNLDRHDHRVGLVGHSHIALSYVRREGEIATGEARRDGDLVNLVDGEWLLNPGSVGQPRDGDQRAAWMLLDNDSWTAEYRRVDYDVRGAQAAIRNARLPRSLADRLEYGQ